MNSSCQEEKSVRQQIIDLLLGMTDDKIAVVMAAWEILLNDSTKSPEECIKLAKEKLGYR